MRTLSLVFLAFVSLLLVSCAPTTDQRLGLQVTCATLDDPNVQQNVNVIAGTGGEAAMAGVALTRAVRQAVCATYGLVPVESTVPPE